MERSAEPIDPVVEATRAVRRARVEQFDLVWRAVVDKEWLRLRFRSPRGWLTAITGESHGACTTTLLLAERIQSMPVARAAFLDGQLSESGLRLLADAWADEIADVFARDESMLVGWVCRLMLREAKTVIDTWVAHADPERHEAAEQERFDRRRFHLSELMDGMGQGDFLLDPEGLRIVRDAISFLGGPVPGDRRSKAQRHADALVLMAKFVNRHHEVPPGTKRRLPKLNSTMDYWSLVERSGVGTIESAHTKPMVASVDAIRRLACDAGVHRYVSGAPDLKVHYGRETRSISEPLFEVLALRDHGCRWDGCSVPSALCEGHHADHWLDHGETEPDNLLLICWYHHHLLHEQHWSIEPLGAGHFKLIDPEGKQSVLRPPTVGAQLPLDLALV